MDSQQNSHSAPNIKRRPGQGLVVDGPSRIEVVKTSPSGVQLRVVAAKETTILRKEALEEQEPGRGESYPDGLPLPARNTD